MSERMLACTLVACIVCGCVTALVGYIRGYDLGVKDERMRQDRRIDRAIRALRWDEAGKKGDDER